MYNIDPSTLSNPRVSTYSNSWTCTYRYDENDETVRHETDDSLKRHHEPLPAADSIRSRQMSTNLKRSTSFPVYYTPVGAINDYVTLTRAEYHANSRSLFINYPNVPSVPKIR